MPVSGSWEGAGHNTVTAMKEAAAAIAQPARRSGIDETGARRVTGRMKASSSEVLAAVRTELTVPEKSTANPAIAIATAASQVAREASVPMQTNVAPTTARAIWFCRRKRTGPPKSTSSNRANEPNAA